MDMLKKNTAHLFVIFLSYCKCFFIVISMPFVSFVCAKIKFFLCFFFPQHLKRDLRDMNSRRDCFSKDDEERSLSFDDF